MRKYQQLFLLIFGVFGVVLMLFYRNEYLKLRAVLNVLNFFGNLEAENSTCLVLGNDLKADAVIKYTFSEPRSSWTKLGNYFIYSSFWDSIAEGGTVRTLAIGPKSSFFDYACRVWFEVGDIITSEAGTFKYNFDSRFSLHQGNHSDYKYSLKCTVRTVPLNSIPYGVLWITPSSRVFAPVSRKRDTEYNSVICVRPDYSAIAKTDIIEFLSFYNAIGVSHFIIYDSGIQHSLFPFIETVTGAKGILRSVTALHWNFPSADAQLETLSLEDDCLSRTFGIAKLVGVVSWNEYILPSNNNFASLISSNGVTDLINVSFETWLCCSEYPDDISSKPYWPTFLRKTRCKKVKREESLYFNRKSYEYSRKIIYEMPSEKAILRRYDRCDKLLMKFVSIFPMPDFYTTVASHKLLQLWKSNRNALTVFS